MGAFVGLILFVALSSAETEKREVERAPYKAGVTRGWLEEEAVG